MFDVDLLDANPNYAWIRHQDGREQTINMRHLARRPRNNSEPKQLEAQANGGEYFADFPQFNNSIRNRFQELDNNENPISVEGQFPSKRAIDFKPTEIKEEPPD